MVMDDPVFRQDDRYFLSTEEAFDSAMKKSIHYIKKTKDLSNLEKNIFLKWAAVQNTFMGADVEVAREDLAARFLELMLKWNCWIA